MYHYSKKLVIKNTVVLIFRHIHFLHLIYSEVAWILVSLGTQTMNHLPDHLSISYDYVKMKHLMTESGYY